MPQTDDRYFLERIRATLPRHFFTAIQEEFDAAYHQALKKANERRETNEAEWSEILGRERHWGCEQALRAAGAAAGLSIATRHTEPAGGRFSIVYCPEFIIGRAKLACPGEKLRITAYRTHFAQLNAFASSRQENLFEPMPTFSSDKLFGLVTAGTDRHNLSVPSFIRFSIPSHDLKWWLFSRPIEEIIASYSEEEKSMEVVPDLIQVKLKNPKSA